MPTMMDEVYIYPPLNLSSSDSREYLSDYGEEIDTIPKDTLDLINQRYDYEEGHSIVNGKRYIRLPAYLHEFRVLINVSKDYHNSLMFTRCAYEIIIQSDTEELLTEIKRFRKKHPSHVNLDDYPLLEYTISTLSIEYYYLTMDSEKSLAYILGSKYLMDMITHLTKDVGNVSPIIIANWTTPDSLKCILLSI